MLAYLNWSRTICALVGTRFIATYSSNSFDLPGLYFLWALRLQEIVSYSRLVALIKTVLILATVDLDY